MAHPSAEDTSGGTERRDRLIPAQTSPLIIRFFARHVRSMFRKRFHSVRMVRATMPALQDACRDDRPLIVVMNHSSWWDPLVPLLLRDEYFGECSPLAPMDRAQLEKFGFFRRLGIFGMDPDDPASLEAMGGYVLEHLRSAARPVFFVTPQGRFADVRTPIRLRPGVASIAAAAVREGLDPNVVCLGMEYAFWVDQKPELFLRVEACEGAHDSTTGWQRAITGAMQRNADALAETVMGRDPDAFATILGGASRVHPLYDLLLRLRGKSASLDDGGRALRHAGGASDGASGSKTPRSEGV